MSSMSPYALPSLRFTHHTAGRVERLFFHCQVFPDSLLLSGGATLALGWGGFAALHYCVAPALMAREGADGLGRPARTALLYATGLCVVRSEGPPALCRALASVPLCAKLCYACEVERRTDEHGDVSNTALRVAGVLLAWGVGALGRSLRGEQRRAGRLGIGAGLTWLRGGAARARRCVDTSPPPPPLSALAV